MKKNGAGLIISLACVNFPLNKFFGLGLFRPKPTLMGQCNQVHDRAKERLLHFPPPPTRPVLCFFVSFPFFLIHYFFKKIIITTVFY